MEALQHVTIKIFANQPASIVWQDLIPIFHRWIRERKLPENLIDVADYAHVPEGPGIMLIAHEAFYSVDNREGRPGLLYNRRTAIDGTVADKLAQAYDAALTASRMLSIPFNEQQVEVSINDRLIAPNNEETWKALEPPIKEFFQQRWGSEPSVTWAGESRDLFRVIAQRFPT